MSKEQRKATLAKIVDRLVTRISAVDKDRDDQDQAITDIQAATTLAQLRAQVVRLQRELNRTRGLVIDQNRASLMQLGMDDGTAPDKDKV